MTDNPTPSCVQQNHKPAIRAYLGGSFNPVHNAHIEMAMQVYNTLAPLASLQQYALSVSLLPNARSPFKQQSLAPKHRLAMLKLAVKNTPLDIDELELWQDPPVYTIDSVQTLRRRYPNDCLIFIMGMDSARSLNKWKQGLQLVDYVNLWIFDRDAQRPHKPCTPLTTQLPKALQTRVVNKAEKLLPSANQPLKTCLKGRIYLDSSPIKQISSTEIRQQLLERALHQSTQKTTDAHLAVAQNSLSTILNPAVYQYIIAHQLYSAA